MSELVKHLQEMAGSISYASEPSRVMAEAAAEIERHEAGYQQHLKIIADLKWENIRLQKELDTAREALEPFAKYRTPDGVDGTDFLRIPDGHAVLFNMGSNEVGAIVDYVVTIGDFRKAAQAYRNLKDKEVAG